MPPSLNLHSTFEQHSPSEEQYIIPHMLTHAQSCLTLCNPMDCSPPGSSVHRILQARIVEWIAIPFSRGSCLPKDRTRVSCISSIAGRFFTAEPLRKPSHSHTYAFIRSQCFSPGLSLSSAGLCKDDWELLPHNLVPCTSWAEGGGGFGPQMSRVEVDAVIGSAFLCHIPTRDAPVTSSFLK